MGVGPLGWSDMDCWARRTGRNPTPDEWQLIRRVDGIYVEVMNAQD